MKWRWTVKTEFIIFLLVVGLFLFPVLADIDGIPFHPNAEYSDLLTSHWPNATFLRNELSNRGEIPLWNPLILGGAPLVADPLFSIWYPPFWLTLIISVAEAFNILILLHLAWAGFGMFKLLRAEGHSRGASIIAGIAFCGTPKMIGHIGLGHLTLISAVAWTPWVMLVIRTSLVRYFDERESNLRWMALPGALVAITFLADPRWLFPICGLTIAYVAYLIFERKWVKAAFRSRSILPVLIFGLTALGLSAGLSLPLSEFLAESTRANINPSMAAEISLPLSNSLKFLVPDFGGSPEILPYVGTLVLGWAIIAILSKAKSWGFWLAITLGALLIAMGDQTPIYSLLAAVVPGMKFIRVPARFLFISAFGLSYLAGIGIDFVFTQERENIRTARLGAVAYGALVLFLGALILFIGSLGNKPAVYMIISSVSFIFLFFLVTNRQWTQEVKIGLWIVLLITELFIVGQSFITIQSNDVTFPEKNPVISAIENERGLERIFSLSYSIPQHIAAENSLQLADGVNPLQLESYVTYMADAVGFSNSTYSVTLPPFPDGDPATPQTFLLDAEKLGYMSVAYVLSAYPIKNSELIFVELIAGTYIYENPYLRPRAWLDGADSQSSSTWREVDEIIWSPNEIVIRAEGPGLLILSEVDYPGWTVTVDGQQSTIERYQEVFRAVSLRAGAHLIKFTFRPRLVFIGGILSMLTIFGLAWVWLKR